MRHLYILLTLSIFSYDVLAQSENNFDSEDSSAFNTLSLYPQSVRSPILESCQYPELLLKIQNLQKKTSKKFQDLIFDYFKSEQKNFWELSRQPGLIKKIAEGGHKSKSELESIASEYPEELKETIIKYGDRFFTDIDAINKLDQRSQSEFNALLKGYPSSAQEAMRQLIKQPEIVGLLCDNMRVTVTIGDLYKKDKEKLTNTMDSISLANATLKAKELKDWKEGLENNPETKNEMLQAAKEFSKENDNYNENADVNINYVVNPYPYWFGYPWWYSYPYWYPNPYWYDWGFYVGPTGFVYVGLPSPFFTHWYFSHHHHHYYYNHFSDYCLSHYYGHRTTHGGFNKEVRTWTKINAPRLSGEFMKDDGQRAVRLKQLGQVYKDQQINPGRKYSKENYRIPVKTSGGTKPINTNTPRKSPVQRAPGKSPSVPKNPKPVIKSKPR
jgi:hypothetical protein